MPERTYAGSVIVFAGAPGSGVSTLVATTARGVKAEGRTALVVNLDPISRSLSALLGAREPAGSLAALLAELDPGLELDPEEELVDSETAISAEQLEGVRAHAVPGISVIDYPRSGPLPPPPSALAVGMLLRHLANQAHVVLVAGVVDPDTRIEIMRQADVRVILYEPTLPSISTAVHCLALLGADCPSTLVQSHARMRKNALSAAQIRYALAERRPRHHHSLRPGPARGRSRREAKAHSGKGVPGSCAPSARAHRPRPASRCILNASRRSAECGDGGKVSPRLDPGFGKECIMCRIQAPQQRVENERA